MLPMSMRSSVCGGEYVVQMRPEPLTMDTSSCLLYAAVNEMEIIASVQKMLCGPTIGAPKLSILVNFARTACSIPDLLYVAILFVPPGWSAGHGAADEGLRVEQQEGVAFRPDGDLVGGVVDHPGRPIGDD